MLSYVHIKQSLCLEHKTQALEYNTSDRCCKDAVATGEQP